MDQSASTVVGALCARSAVGLKSASTVGSALIARSAVGLKSASTVASALNARSAAGLNSASTVVGALGVRSAVVHQSASTTVSALRARSAVGLKSASTVVGATHARSAVGLKSASTVVSALSAKRAVGAQSASTVVGALHARSVAPRRLGNDVFVVGVVHYEGTSELFLLPRTRRLPRLAHAHPQSSARPFPPLTSPRVSDGRPREHLAQRRTRSFAPERKLGRAARVRRSVPASSVKLSDKTQSRKTTKKGPYPCLVPAHERLWCAQSSRAHASPQYL